MQTIVITGSTWGIGKGLAREFLKLGHRVVVTGRSQAAVDHATAELGSLGEILGCVCDVRDMASLEAVWAAAVARFSRVDIWSAMPLWQPTARCLRICPLSKSSLLSKPLRRGWLPRHWLTRNRAHVSSGSRRLRLRFATAAFRKRDIISPLEARANLKVR